MSMMTPIVADEGVWQTPHPQAISHVFSLIRVLADPERAEATLQRFAELQKVHDEKTAVLEQRERAASAAAAAVEHRVAEASRLEAELAKHRESLATDRRNLDERDRALADRAAALDAEQKRIADRAAEVERKAQEHAVAEAALTERRQAIERSEAALAAKHSELDGLRKRLADLLGGA